jgi:GT2 family glycosyltransferase
VGGRLDRQSLNDPVSAAWRIPLQDDALPIGLMFLEYSLGANFGIWATVLRTIGGWHEDYSGGCDDVELCWRAQLSGYRLGFARDAVIRYRYRAELMAMARQVYAYGFAEPLLHRDFAEYGLPPHGAWRHVSELLWLASRAWSVVWSRESRGRWLCYASYWAGRACGSLNHRQPGALLKPVMTRQRD